MEAYPVGSPVYEDDEGIKFYDSYELDGRVYHVRDCVMINTTEENSDDVQVEYGQITAIFEDPSEEDPELSLKLEVRWLLKADSVRLVKTRKIKILPNEVIESCVVDDIPVGAVMETIKIFGPKEQNTPEETMSLPPAKRTRRELSPSVKSGPDNYPCRFFQNEQEDTLLPIDICAMWQRSAQCSDFARNYDAVAAKKSEPISLSEGKEGQDRFSKAVAQLHVSVLPSALPCREDEQKKIYQFLKSAMTAGGRKRPLYISGMPGTGKTATVQAAIASLRKDMAQQSSSKDHVCDFEFIEINCLRISSPQEAYTVLWRGLSGEFVGPQIALGRLKSYFEDIAARSNAPSTAKPSQSSVKPTNYVICLLDELDYLVTKNESIVYNFFDWPQLHNSGLIVVGIANTMDLPERLNKRSLSRLGGQQLMRIAFKAYTHEQINDILADRLRHLEGVFEAKSLQLTARKAASAAGDLRSALKICQRAIELHRDNQLVLHSKLPPDELKIFAPVTLQMVTRAAAEYKENPLMVATGAACNLDKAIFIGMCRYNRSTGVAEMTVEETWDRTRDVIEEYGKFAAGGGLDTLPPWPVFHEALSRLVQQGMLNVVGSSSAVRQQSARGVFTYSTHTMLSPRLLHSDIVAALKDVKDPMAAEVWPLR